VRGLAAITALGACLLCAGLAQARPLRLGERQARHATVDYTRSGPGDIGRIVVGRCKRHSRIGFRCRISYRGISGPVAGSRGSLHEWVSVRQRGKRISVRSWIFATFSERAT
jgi:hypothetical protein